MELFPLIRAGKGAEVRALLEAGDKLDVNVRNEKGQVRPRTPFFIIFYYFLKIIFNFSCNLAHLDLTWPLVFMLFYKFKNSFYVGRVTDAALLGLRAQVRLRCRDGGPAGTTPRALQGYMVLLACVRSVTREAEAVQLSVRPTMR
jgi:hypothetical protein